jgi:hypothetical protein
MLKKYQSLVLPVTAIAFLAGCISETIEVASKDGITVTAGKYRRDKKSYDSFVIENRFYKATLVPSSGGRIVSLVDKKRDLNLVYNKGYGGLLDDHGAMFKMPYQAKWLKKNHNEAIVQLANERDGKVYVKTVTFSAIRPVIKVKYQVENHTQDALRLLFRNVVRPGGTTFSGTEVYCYVLRDGLRKNRGIPRVDHPAEQWAAVVDPAKKSVVGIAFEGNAVERLYTWRGSKVAPTFEYMMRRLPAGHKIDFQYYWFFCEGLGEVDYASRDLAVELNGKKDRKKLTLEMKLIPLWKNLKDLEIGGVVLDEKRQKIGTIKTVKLTSAELGKLQKINLTATIHPGHKFVSAVIKLQADGLSYTPQIVEKAFPTNGAKAIAGLKRPVRTYGAKNQIGKVAGWSKEVSFVIMPDALAKQRGYMVFEEFGPTAGEPVKTVKLQTGIKEYDSFPLHFKSLGWSGKVAVKIKAPAGINVESFNTVKMPQKLWGKIHYGLKMLPATNFSVAKGEDKVIYFRLRAAEKTKPGLHNVKISFVPEKAQKIVANVKLDVYPIIYPPQPKMVFDVNNVVNYLCAEKDKRKKYQWAPTRAANYLADMRDHGVRSQTLSGINSPEATYYYSKVKLFGSKMSLTDAIKKNPERFRNRLDLPKLDFSYWDFLVDKLLEYEQRNVRWPTGGCGSRFYQKHNKLTKRIYKKTFPDNDSRQNVIRDWYNREVIRYLKDRGITRTLVTIDDEIPAEKLAWWVQHANTMLGCNAEAGVTQSAHTLADDMLINIVAPFMKFWIIGTLHKQTFDLRRKQGIIKPEHWQTTYHSSANHWRKYSQTRSQCGFNPAYFELDACWIQVYYRWRQSEAIIYPAKDRPYDSAAWEGARDGLDDGNYYLLALSMIRALPKTERDIYLKRLGKIVGEGDDALIKFTERLTGVGHVTAMGRYHGKVFKPWYDAATMNRAKRQTLELIKELIPKVPVQKAAADFGTKTLIRDGRSIYVLPAGMPGTANAVKFLKKAAAPLKFTRPEPVKIKSGNKQAMFFFGTVAELRKLLPKRAKESGLADLNKDYPGKGQYVIRFVRPDRTKANNKMYKGKYAKPVYPESLYIICADNAGAEKALNLLPRVVSQPDFLYSHWLKKHIIK